MTESLEHDTPGRQRAREGAHRRTVVRQRLAALVGAVIVLVAVTLLSGISGKRPPAYVSPLIATGTGRGHLYAGSPAALPGRILVADRENNRLVVITPLGQLAWSEAVYTPSDAYLSPTRRSIVVTQHSAFVVLELSVLSGQMFYSYGHGGRPGTANDRLHDPQTGQQLPDGQVLITDKLNCRVLVVSPPARSPAVTLGRAGVCVHNPPTAFSYPEAAFPTAGGGLVVTETTADWVDLLSRNHRLLRAFRVQGLSAPYDANEFAAGRFVATSHSFPGAVEEFTATGRVLWRYAPGSGPGELDLPSLAQVLPNGDVLVSDSDNDRVVVIEPRDNAIVWQFGHRGQAGSRPGFLNKPDSATLLP
jgi:hypothetical protein